jgi:type IV pilus assembly protein PilM
LSFFDTVQRWVAEPPPDHLFEITEVSLSAVSSRNPGQPREQVFVERALAVSPSAPNLSKPELYREAFLRLRNGGPAKQMGAALVIPDYSVRMTVLDFEEFPQGEQERNALVRFRLRKSVPFHIEEAQVSYAIQLQVPKRVEVLAVAIAKPILNEYEALFSEAGYQVGLIVPSAIAALPLCPSNDTGFTIVAKAAGSTLTVLLLEQGMIRLARCLNLASPDEEGVTIEGELSVLDLVQQSLAYAEDQLGQSVKRLLLCGFGVETDLLGKLAQKEFGIPYANLRSRFGAASQENAGLLGLLEQYIA